MVYNIPHLQKGGAYMSRKFVTKKEMEELTDEELYDMLWRSDPAEFIKMVKKMDILHIRVLQKIYFRADFEKELKLAARVIDESLNSLVN